MASWCLFPGVNGALLTKAATVGCCISDETVLISFIAIGWLTPAFFLVASLWHIGYRRISSIVLDRPCENLTLSRFSRVVCFLGLILASKQQLEVFVCDEQ